MKQKLLIVTNVQPLNYLTDIKYVIIFIMLLYLLSQRFSWPPAPFVLQPKTYIHVNSNHKHTVSLASFILYMGERHSQPPNHPIQIPGCQHRYLRLPLPSYPSTTSYQFYPNILSIPSFKQFLVLNPSITINMDLVLTLTVSYLCNYQTLVLCLQFSSA